MAAGFCAPAARSPEDFDFRDRARISRIGCQFRFALSETCCAFAVQIDNAPVKTALMAGIFGRLNIRNEITPHDVVIIFFDADIKFALSRRVFRQGRMVTINRVKPVGV